MSNRQWSTNNGPRRPAAGVRLPQAPAFRRTSHVDVVRRVGNDAGVVVSGAGRDLAIFAGRRQALATEAVSLTADANRVVTELRSTSPSVDAPAVVGQQLGRGFRRAGTNGVGDDLLERSLIDDVAIVGLLANYVDYYLGETPGSGFARPDLCAGWVSGGVLLTAIDSTGDVPLPRGPLAPRLTTDADEGWHDVPDLPKLALRRARRIDVGVRHDTFAVDAMFRDSFTDPHGVERVIHEYSLTARVDSRTREISAIEAEPRVLPWKECPRAAASVDALVGRRLDDVHHTISANFRGTSTCTHLNTLLHAMVAPLRQAADTHPVAADPSTRAL